MLASNFKIGQNHLHFDEIVSTNTFAYDLLSKTNPIDGTVISADYQTAGKGQFGRKWVSNKGENLIMSVILFPSFLFAHQQIYLSIAVALALHDYVNEISSDCRLKWPNDIYVNNSKLAGILIQNQVQGDIIKSSVIGIGMNINQQVFDTDITNPTSLKIIASKHFDIKNEMIKLWAKLENRYLQISDDDQLEKIKNEYTFKMYKLYEKVKVSSANEEIYTAILNGIDSNGRLVVRSEDGDIRTLTHGEVNLHYDTY